MFERFTERARQVVVLAQDEARKSDLGYIGCEHILLGLLREEESLGARILKELGVTLDKARESAKARYTGSGEPREGQIPLTPRAKRVLELALREALSLGHNYIGTEHVLLGLIRENGNVALEILQEDFSLTAEKVRNKVIRMLSGPKAPILQKDRDSVRASEPVEPKADLYTKDEVVGMINDALTMERNFRGRDVAKIISAVFAMR